MAGLFSDLLCFTRALWKEWKALLTGSSVAAVLALWKLVDQKALPGNLAWSALALTLAYATFLVWRKEYKAARGPSQAIQAAQEATWARSTGQRVWVDRPLDSLVQPYKEYTKIEADSLMSATTGKWLRVSGEVRQVSKGFGSKGHEVLVLNGKIMLELEFAPEWDQYVVLLHKGQFLRAVGRIRWIRESEIWLENCEILPSPPEP